MSQCILVLGTPRSGTSCVAGVLHHLGVPMGKYFPPPDELNPGGYFQDREFEFLLDEKLQGQWPVWTTAKTQDEHADKIAALARERSAEHSLWGAKSNRLIHYLQSFIEGAGKIKIITTTRPHAASVASWKARVNPNHNAADAVIRRMRAGVAGALAECGIAPILTVDFDEMIENPEPVVARIADAVGLDVTPEAIEWINADWRRFTDG